MIFEEKAKKELKGCEGNGPILDDGGKVVMAFSLSPFDPSLALFFANVNIIYNFFLCQRRARPSVTTKQPFKL